MRVALLGQVPGSAGDQLVSGVVEQLPLEAGQAQGLVQVGVDLELAGITAQTEVVPPKLVDGDVRPGDGLLQ